MENKAIDYRLPVNSSNLAWHDGVPGKRNGLNIWAALRLCFSPKVFH